MVHELSVDGAGLNNAASQSAEVADGALSVTGVEGSRRSRVSPVTSLSRRSTVRLRQRGPARLAGVPTCWRYANCQRALPHDRR